MEEEESAEDLSTVVKDWMKQNDIKGETEDEPDQVDVYENAIANRETDEEEMDEVTRWWTGWEVVNSQWY